MNPKDSGPSYRPDAPCPDPSPARARPSPRPALRTQLGYPGSVHIPTRTSDALALGAVHGYAGPHALADEFALELRDAREDAKHESSIWGRSVHTFVQRDKLNAQLVEFAEGIDQLAQTAGETVIAITTNASTWRRLHATSMRSNSGRRSRVPLIPTSTYSPTISQPRRAQYSRVSASCISGFWPA